MRRVMVIDTRRCVGCEACVVACKTENGVPEGKYRDWVVQETRGEFPLLDLVIQSQRCNHCVPGSRPRPSSGSEPPLTLKRCSTSSSRCVVWPLLAWPVIVAEARCR